MAMMPMEYGELLSGTASGTTTAGGALVTNISTSGKYIVGACSTDVVNTAIAPFTSTTNTLAFRVQDTSLGGYNVKSNTAITIKYFYTLT